jgi:diketogulonate reductase-like aldo/keto reductase
MSVEGYKMKEISIDTKMKLNNGVEMPVFGLGTFLSQIGKETYNSVLYALEAGYIHVDTAQIYGNEKDVGDALRKSSIPREDVFITTKCAVSNHGYDATLASFEVSLKKMGLSYVDLYLSHWPVPGLRIETWKAMEKLLEEGKCRAVGVSNYIILHLEELLENSSIVPAVNQVEFSPYLYQKDLLEFCRSHGIQLEAYSPITKGYKLSDPRLVAIASQYSKTPAQILIRWGLQREVIVIVKSVKKERILENADVFDFMISPEDMKTLDSFNENLHTGWDPSNQR